jgi:hypothetical protein
MSNRVKAMSRQSRMQETPRRRLRANFIYQLADNTMRSASSLLDCVFYEEDDIQEA